MPNRYDPAVSNTAFGHLYTAQTPQGYPVGGYYPQQYDPVTAAMLAEHFGEPGQLQYLENLRRQQVLTQAGIGAGTTATQLALAVVPTPGERGEQAELAALQEAGPPQLSAADWSRLYGPGAAAARESRMRMESQLAAREGMSAADIRRVQEIQAEGTRRAFQEAAFKASDIKAQQAAEDLARQRVLADRETERQAHKRKNFMEAVQQVGGIAAQLAQAKAPVTPESKAASLKMRGERAQTKAGTRAAELGARLGAREDDEMGLLAKAQFARAKAQYARGARLQQRAAGITPFAPPAAAPAPPAAALSPLTEEDVRLAQEMSGRFASSYFGQPYAANK